MKKKMNLDAQKGSFPLMTGMFAALILLITLGTAGCSTLTGGEATPAAVPRDPFSARSESEDGAIVSWSGFLDGYQPGEEAEIEFTVKNETDQIWKGRFCINLISGQADPAVQVLGQREFDLVPGMGFSDAMTIKIPEGVGAGAYGLSTVAHRPSGPMVDVVTIQVGESREKGQGYTQREMDASREACPPLDQPPRSSILQVPDQDAEVTLPLHLLARTSRPDEALTARLRWMDGTVLMDSFTTMRGPQGGGVLVRSLDWNSEGRPAQPGTSQATLTLEDDAGGVLAEANVTVLDSDHPDTRLIDLYWLAGERLVSEQRRVLAGENIERTALEELLWGPPPRNLAGFQTALPSPQEVLNYPGRQEDWGIRVELLDLTVENGTATANFSREMRAYGGGSARVGSIRDQITSTLTQFETVDDVVIAVAGETEGVLQP